MNYKNLTISILIFLLALLAACSDESADDKIRGVLSEVQRLQDEEENFIKEFVSRENIWLGEQLDRFPANRNEIEPVAKQQIETLTRIIELEQRQIEELRKIPAATQDENYRTLIDLQTKLFEKRLEGNKLAINRFELVSDANITTRGILDQHLTKMKISQDQIDNEIIVLEQKMVEHRKRIDK